MSHRAKIYLIALVIAAAGVTWALTRLLAPEPSSAPTSTATAAPPVGTAHITATLFYGSPDGQRSCPCDATSAAGRRASSSRAGRFWMRSSQDAPPPYMSTSFRRARSCARSTSPSAATPSSISAPKSSPAHPGGSLNELLTVYAIVNAVTANLPAVQRVQILVDGKEADTIAGHVDLRRPLARDTIAGAGRPTEQCLRGHCKSTYCNVQCSTICDQTAVLRNSSAPPASRRTT